MCEFLKSWKLEKVFSASLSENKQINISYIMSGHGSLHITFKTFKSDSREY